MAGKRPRLDGTATSPIRRREKERPDRSPSPETETVDEPDSRPKRPLPLITPAAQAHAMNSAPFAFPNPEDMTGLPTMADQNPHTKLTRADPAPTVLPDADHLAIPFTNAQFERIAVPFSRLTRNMPDDVVEMVGSTHNTLAVVPFGPGAEFYKNNPHANRDVEKFLHSLLYDTNGVQVSMPLAKHTPKGAFDGPYPMILTGCSEDLAKFLVWNQTFSINDKLTFNVFPFDPSLVSWVVMTISGDAVHPEADAKRRVLGAIKERLWNDTTFLNFCNVVLGAAGVPGSGKQRVVEATKTFDLTYIETDDAHGDRAPVYQLTAKPISSDPATHRKWLALIRSLRGSYRVGYNALVINKRWVDCSYCLSEMHPAHSCTLPNVDRWLGMKPDNAARHAARIEKMKEKEQSNNKGKGRGNGKSRGGWNNAERTPRGRKRY
ncbi:hypothetical protein B0H13DRAFT_2040175 [Mycena leptocephala]|nr:hypothetical protein B0H13DRAFT_2040175 [Mycena leptocephala]